MPEGYCAEDSVEQRLATLSPSPRLWRTSGAASPTIISCNMQPDSASDLDLHGFTVAEAIERFVQQYNTRVDNHQFGSWKIIHGYGSSGKGGAIRIKLRAFLDLHPDKLRYEAGDDYGDPGWTWVYPKNRLPDQRERMAAAILDFCAEGRTEERILREFSEMGEVQVKQVVRSLAKQGRLKTVTKGTKTVYQVAR